MSLCMEAAIVTCCTSGSKHESLEADFLMRTAFPCKAAKGEMMMMTMKHCRCQYVPSICSVWSSFNFGTELFGKTPVARNRSSAQVDEHLLPQRSAADKQQQKKHEDVADRCRLMVGLESVHSIRSSLVEDEVAATTRHARQSKPCTCTHPHRLISIPEILDRNHVDISASLRCGC